jgi:uncharacterized Zn ribbon protein
MRIKKCQRCGKKFIAPTGHHERSLCDECRKEAKHDSVFRKRICKDCGKEFIGYPRSFYCPTCKEKRMQEKNSHAHKTKRPIGSIDICVVCGKEYVVKGGRQKYCPDCAKTEVRKNISNRKKKYNAAHQDKIRNRKKKALKDAYICPICGRAFTKKGTNSETCSSECAKKLSEKRRNNNS